MTRTFAVLMMLGSLGLAACAPQTETTIVPVVNQNLPGAQACRAAIARTANAPVENVVIAETLAMAAGTQVTATIAGYNGSWTCLGAADGRVSGVAYKR